MSDSLFQRRNPSATGRVIKTCPGLLGAHTIAREPHRHRDMISERCQVCANVASNGRSLAALCRDGNDDPTLPISTVEPGLSACFVLHEAAPYKYACQRSRPEAVDHLATQTSKIQGAVWWGMKTYHALSERFALPTYAQPNLLDGVASDCELHRTNNSYSTQRRG